MEPVLVPKFELDAEERDSPTLHRFEIESPPEYVEDNVVNEEEAWSHQLLEPSLPEVNGSIKVAKGDNVPWWRTLLSYIGPGALIAVGYMDPGNWSTDLAGGSKFGYSLLFVIMLSSLFGMFLQYLAVKCGLCTSRDLAQACRDSYPRPVVFVLWVICEVAIAATDLAEVIGSAVAMKLLFGLPLIAGVCLTAFDILIFLFLQGSKFRVLECIVGVLVLLITACFAAEVGLSKPEAIPLLSGFLPNKDLIYNSEKMFIAAGIVGATVMPHNLFLHSSIVLTRENGNSADSLKYAVRYATVDCTMSLAVAWFVNSSILIVAAATFYSKGYREVATLEEASKLLDPLLGSTAASILFGIALLASGQNATLTGTLSGQIVMEGFINWKINPVYRRILTRLVAILPAVIATCIGGDKAVNNLLILSQVILCFALPFAVFPLIHITSNKKKMGDHVNWIGTTFLAFCIGLLIVCLNIFVLIG